MLSNVRLTGTELGAGAYGTVDEVEIPVGAAAKTNYDVLHGNAGPRDAVPKAVTEFVSECKMMSALRHPNIVQFLGVCFFPGSRLPALVMERLLTMRAAATMTKAPGASVYMPPEAIAPAASNAERSKYDASIDIFSFGVVTIFTIGETFPCDPLAPNYFNESSGLLVARTELQRRSGYMRNVNAQLRACGQLRGDHPLIRLIQQCLHNRPHKRPNIGGVLHLLDEARAGIRDEESERNRQELVRALQTQPRIQVRQCITIHSLHVVC